MDCFNGDSYLTYTTIYYYLHENLKKIAPIYWNILRNKYKIMCRIKYANVVRNINFP